MKEHAKKALKHDFQVAGKTIPTLAVAALFLVGTGSAALLSSFGTVSGEAQVKQSIVVDGNTATSTSGPKVTSDISSSDVIAGNVVESTHVVENNANVTAEVKFTDTTSDEDVTSKQVVAERWAVDGGESFNVDVETSTENVYSSDYSIHFSSDGTSTSDYAIAYFEVDSVSSSSELTYWGVADGDNPLDDEVWIRESDGDTYWLSNTDVTKTGDESEGLSKVSASFSSTWYKSQDGSVTTGTPTWSEVTAVGIGQGSPQASEDYVVDTYVDSVKVGDETMTSVDEDSTQTIPVAPTASKNDIDFEYRYLQVTPLDVALMPDTYTVSSQVTTP